MSEQIRQLRRVAVAGDWGSNLPWARARLHELGADGVELLLHVGDLNLTTGSSGEAYLDALEEACRVTAVTLLLTPGNHDDADYIAALELTDRHDGYGSIGWVRDHIGVLPRGHRFSVATPAGTVRSFVSLGGAASGSCAWSVPGQDWWPAEQITDAKAKAMFQEALGAPLDVEIIARSSWTAGYTLVAEKFQRGRIFLGGDAVHLFTPAGGLGYNTAVEDAVNLGWKLNAMLKGWGGPALLETYETERQAIARRNTAYARGFADSLGLFVPPPELWGYKGVKWAQRITVGDRFVPGFWESRIGDPVTRIRRGCNPSGNRFRRAGTV